MRSASCTGWPPGGTPAITSQWRLSVTPRGRRTGSWLPACLPITGQACTSAGRAPPSTSRWAGSPAEAKRYLTLAALGSVSVPEGRRGRVQTLLGVVGLLLARQRGNPPAVAEEARRLQAMAEAPDAARPGLSGELRALALINLGIAEYGVARFEEAEPHLEQGVALARRVGRPHLEFTGMAYQAAIEVSRSYTRGGG